MMLHLVITCLLAIVACLPPITGNVAREATTRLAELTQRSGIGSSLSGGLDQPEVANSTLTHRQWNYPLQCNTESLAIEDIGACRDKFQRASDAGAVDCGGGPKTIYLCHHGSVKVTGAPQEPIDGDCKEVAYALDELNYRCKTHGGTS